MRFYLMAALVGICSTAAIEITPQVRIIVDTFLDAFSGYSRKEQAAFQQLDEKHWARQVAAEGGAHVSAYRMALAPDSVITDWIKRMAPAFGLRVFDRQDDIVRLIDAATEMATAYQEINKDTGRRTA